MILACLSPWGLLKNQVYGTLFWKKIIIKITFPLNIIYIRGIDEIYMISNFNNQNATLSTLPIFFPERPRKPNNEQKQ